ncbi:MAG: hypothetical protein Q7T25_10845 [Sideroxyarcus sp.]|nr:hypothetical protein [Sideroxyarcus sp.]
MKYSIFYKVLNGATSVELLAGARFSVLLAFSACSNTRIAVKIRTRYSGKHRNDGNE